MPLCMAPQIQALRLTIVRVIMYLYVCVYECMLKLQHAVGL